MILGSHQLLLGNRQLTLGPHQLHLGRHQLTLGRHQLFLEWLLPLLLAMLNQLAWGLESPRQCQVKVAPIHLTTPPRSLSCGRHQLLLGRH